MQFEYEAPGKANIVLESRDITAEVEIDVPKKVPKQPSRDAKSSHLTQLLPTLLVLYLLLDKRARVSRDQEDHESKSDFVDVDLVSPAVVDGDWDHGTKDRKRVVSLLGGRGLEAEELVQDCADGEEHAQVVAHLAVVLQRRVEPA